jgi:endonuclease YncB( thermonuclease family)
MKINWKISSLIIWSAIVVSLLWILQTQFSKDRNKTTEIPKESYQVIYVHDGDSFSINFNGKTQRVRLMGTDAPELNQPYGKYARDLLAELILNKRITFIYQTADHYQRFLGRISVVNENDETLEIPDVGFELIKKGATWPHRTHKSFRSQYLAAQNEAQINKLGLWGDERPTSPKEYRKSH